MSTNEEVELGDLVKDYITGFEGIVVAVTDWLYGCKRVSVQPRGLTSGEAKFEQGKPLEAQSFDIDGVELLQKGAVPTRNTKVKAVTRSGGSTTSTGGPVPNEHVALRR